MVIVTYSFGGNLPMPHRLLFPVSSRGSFICTFPQENNTYRSLWWTSCGPLVEMENRPNCKCIHCAGSIGWSKLSPVSGLPSELCMSHSCDIFSWIHHVQENQTQCPARTIGSWTIQQSLKWCNVYGDAVHSPVPLHTPSPPFTDAQAHHLCESPSVTTDYQTVSILFHITIQK